MPDVDDFDFRRDRAEEREWSAPDHQPGEVAARVEREEAIRKAAGVIDGTDDTIGVIGSGLIARALDKAGLLVTPQHDASVPMPPLPKPGTPEWNDFARLANELGRVAPSLLFSERSRAAVALLASDWLRLHDAEVWEQGASAAATSQHRSRHFAANPHRPPLTELPETPVCATCRGDETVPLVGAPGGQFTACGDCVIAGIPAED